MAISEPISLPSQSFARVVFQPVSAVAVSRSPFSFEEKVHAWSGQMMGAEVRVTMQDTVTEAGAWEAFFLKCNGRERRFLLGDPLRTAPTGSGAGTPVLDGAHSPEDSTISTTGWDVSETGVLLAGDLIQLGSGVSSRLHKVLSDVDSDGSGNADIEIWPSLRASYADTTPLTLDNAKGIFRLATNNPEWRIDPPSLYRFSFNAVEAL